MAKTSIQENMANRANPVNHQFQKLIVKNSISEIL